MKNLLTVIAILAIYTGLHAQGNTASKIPINRIGKFGIGDNISSYMGTISQFEKGPDTVRFGVHYYYTSGDATHIFGANATSTSLNFCSGEMIGVTIDFKEITFDKAMSIQKQLIEKAGQPDSYSANRFPNDSTGMKRQSWTWRSGDNNLVFLYDDWNGRTSAAILLHNSTLVLKCMARGATTQVHP